eukprot:6266571-Amphidinium_carterae.2
MKRAPEFKRELCLEIFSAVTALGNHKIFILGDWKFLTGFSALKCSCLLVHVEQKLSRRGRSSEVGGRSSEANSCSIAPSQLNGIHFRMKYASLLQWASTNKVSTVLKEESVMCPHILVIRALCSTSTTSPVAVHLCEYMAIEHCSCQAARDCG